MRDAAEIDGLQFFTAIVHVWVDEDPFSPLLDLAVRDWSRTSKKLAQEVAEMDNLRISLLTRAFRALGYSQDESLVRARITYFHQIGYYTLSFKEDAAERRRYQPLYGKVLLGPLVDEAAEASSAPCVSLADRVSAQSGNAAGATISMTMSACASAATPITSEGGGLL